MTMKMARDVYSHEQLKRLLDPASVAVVGASENASAFGARTLSYLQGYSGRVYPVNAKYRQLGDRMCYPDLTSLPEVPDCVVAAVPRPSVEALVDEAVTVGAGGLVLYASGFAETGLPDREAQQERLTARVAGTSTRLIGPNCLGILTGHSGLVATFAYVPYPPRPGRPPGIGLISQSGAMGAALLQAGARGVNFSHMLAPGNSADVDVADLISFLADEPSCAVIACVFEGTSSPQRLLQAAAVARRQRKPVLVCKIAAGEEGAAAAKSHTGSLAGSAATWQALFEHAGFVVIDGFDALVEAASFFAKAPPCRGRGVSVITPSGGAGILCADAGERLGVPLPQPSPEVTATLQSVVPEFGAARNPCDVTAQVINDTESLSRCAAAMVSDPRIGALVVPHITAYPEATARTLAIGEAARQGGVAFCVTWVSEWLEGPGAAEMEADATAAVFHSTERCFRTLAAWHRWSESLATAEAGHEGIAPTPATAVRDVAQALRVVPSGSAVVEREAKQLLAAYGIDVVPERLVHSAPKAVQAARDMGLPVVLKVESADIPHKTEAGVVRLNLKDDEAVATAYEAVMAAARKQAAPDRIAGVLVQPMLQGGLEVLVGGRIDPDFGPMVVVGLGGVFVELLRDTVTAMAPVSPAQALSLLHRLRGKQLFDGFRGSAPVDLPRLAETVSAASRFIADHAALLSEVDLNPLICSGTRAVAVDALLLRA